VSQGSRNPRNRNATKVAASRTAAADDTPDYPGKQFGLPMTGPSSVAPMGRRLLALLIDWVLCFLIASSIVRHNVFAVTDARYQDAQWVALLLFVFEVYLLTAISGLTVGKRLLGLRAIRTDGRRPGFKWAAVRTVLLLFVVPACLTDRDLRGLHDRAADTIVVRMLPQASAAAWACGGRGRPWAAGPSASASSAGAP
jgi:uncharacterized RDD family membrane protein YckC